MTLRNIKMTLAYDGTDFCGYQIQKNERTVQGELEKALFKMLEKSVRVTAAGRTDTGVHAIGQMINFKTDYASIPTARFHLALNSYLPPDINALSAEEASEDFSARYSALYRVYRYYIYTNEKPLPHLRRYCLWRKHLPDLAALNRIASVVVGEHDFSTFSAVRDSSRCKIRRIISAGFYLKAPYLVFQIIGNAFLWKMVRSILGTILELEEQDRDADEMKRLLLAKERTLAGQTVAARGLFLEKVVYNEDEKWFS